MNTSNPARRRNRIVEKGAIVAACSVAALLIIFVLNSNIFAFFALQAEGIKNAGTWEDDSKNWYRAFREDPPAKVKVVHSKYWRSNHFTYEFMYFFEVEASPEWREAFLKKRGLVQVPESQAGSYRAYNGGADIPTWYAPDPVDLYEVWDRPGHHGSVWINKTNGHVFFHDSQL